MACILEACYLHCSVLGKNSENICVLSYLYLTELMLMKYMLPKRRMQSKTWIKIRGLIQVYVKKMEELIFLLLV